MTTNPTARLSTAGQFALLAGPMLSMIDSSIVNVAAPNLMRGLHASLSEVQWIASAYLLALGFGLCLVPWLSSRIGSARLYRAGMAGFVLASIACSLSPSLPLLVAARIAQGLLAAPLTPLAMSAALGTGRERRSVSAAAGIVLFVAPAFGPVLGSVLLRWGEWPWMFWINVPVGVGALLSWRAVPASVWPGASGRRRFDPLGLTLLAPGLLSVLVGTHFLPVDGWGAWRSGGAVALGTVALVAFTAYAIRRPGAVVDLRAIPARIGATAVGLSCLATVVNFATVFLLPTYLQQAQHRSVLVAGLSLLPAGLVTGIATALGDRAAERWGVRPTVVVGFAGLLVTSLGFAILDAHTPLIWPVLMLCGRGAAVGLITVPLLTELSERVEPRGVDDANTAFNLAQRVAASVGIAGMTGLYTRAPDAGTGLHDLSWALGGLALIGLVGAALALRRRSPIVER